jgi:hypothetical protein
MKNAIWLFLYLLLHADRRSGGLFRKIKTISLDTGIKERTIREWLENLRDQDYIETRNKGHCLSIVIKKWKTFSGRQEEDNEVGKARPFRVAESCQPEGIPPDQNSSYPSEKLTEGLDPNDNDIKKDILKNEFEPDSFKGLNMEIEEDQLALDLARDLNDPNGFPLYRSYAARYPEPFLRKILEVVNKIPSEKIRKSRGALFNYLIQQHGHKASQNPGN